MGAGIGIRHDRLRSTSEGESIEEDDPYWQDYEWPRNQSRSESKDSKSNLVTDDPDLSWCGGCCFPAARLEAGEAGQIPKRIDKRFVDLWDVHDPAFLDKVCCECLIKVTRVDPKESRFELRMKCKWTFRTLHSDEKTETKLRVPGIRLPGLIVEVNESRVWKDLQKTKGSENTVFWRGVSLFTITGFERFEMLDFPFDRQVMSLDIFEFVWQADKDSTDYDFSMHIVSFRLETMSMLPEWEAATAIIEATNVRVQHKSGLHVLGASAGSEATGYAGGSRSSPRGSAEQRPSYANRFKVQLRLQRNNWFYLIQIFGLSILITMASTIPLLMPANRDHIGSRLGLYSGGVLTLTSFKYSVGDQLPSVPYSTKFDRIMLTEVVTLIGCALESLVAYRFVEDGVEEQWEELESHNDWGWMSIVRVDTTELFLFFFLTCWWLATWLHLSADRWGMQWVPGVMKMKFKHWSEVVENQEGQADFDELENWDHKESVETEKHNGKELQRLSLEICDHLGRRGSAEEMDPEELTRFEKLKEKRNQLERQMSERKHSEGPPRSGMPHHD